MDVVSEAFVVTRQLRADGGWRARVIRAYWRVSFLLTWLWERVTEPRPRIEGRSVMNYGCGNKFYEGAVNADLLAPHRFLLGKRRPDLYWTGTTELGVLRQRFEGIVCEHVIEHMLPDGAVRLFGSLRAALQPGAHAVVSFPDLRKVLDGGRCQGFESTAASINALIYRHGHCFMYDTALVCDLLRQAGFCNVHVADFGSLPLQEYLSPGRVPETSYILAECPAASR